MHDLRKMFSEIGKLLESIDYWWLLVIAVLAYVLLMAMLGTDQLIRCNID